MNKKVSLFNSLKISTLGALLVLAGSINNSAIGKTFSDVSTGNRQLAKVNVDAQTSDRTPPLEKQPIKQLKLAPHHSFELALMNKMLQHFHYKKFRLDDNLSEKILKQYLESLDPNKMYFTQTDINAFNQFKDKFDDYINVGNTDVALKIFKVYQKRVKQRAQYGIERLAKPFNLNSDKTYQLDRENAHWESDQAALNKLWDKRIENDYINQLLNDKTDVEAKKDLEKRYQHLAKRVKQIKPNEVFQIIANAYTASIEPHTNYLSPRSSKQFDIDMKLSLGGIGAILGEDDEYTKIIRVIPGGPAALSGKISKGDRIVGVGKSPDTVKDVIGWRLNDVVGLIRGKKGSNVTLSILPKETGVNGKAETVTIVRDKIKLEQQAASKRIITVGNDKIGVITLPSFYIDFNARSRGNSNYVSTTHDVKKLLLELEKENIDGLIIDLRGNGGGSLSEVVSLTDLFIDTGPVVQIKDSSGHTDILKDKKSGVVYSGPLAVMIDKGSASASEIFAGAIKDYKRGIIIGENTFGKGTVQTILPLSNYSQGHKFNKPLGELKITTAQFFRINGDSTQHKGVAPDITWNLPKSDTDFGESTLKNSLPWRHIQPAGHYISANKLNNEELKKLGQLSTQRRNHTEKFVATMDKIKLLVVEGNKKLVSLNLAKRKLERRSFDEKLLSLENQIRKANGETIYKTIKVLHEAQKKQNEEIYTKKKKVDVFLNEAAHILRDAIHLKKKLNVLQQASIYIKNNPITKES